MERDEPPPEVAAILAEVLTPRLFRHWLEQQTKAREGMAYWHAYAAFALAGSDLELDPDWWVLHHRRARRGIHRDPELLTHWMRVIRSTRECAGEVRVPEWLLGYEHEVTAWADEQFGQRATPDARLVPVAVAVELLDEVLKDLGSHL